MGQKYYFFQKEWSKTLILADMILDHQLWSGLGPTILNVSLIFTYVLKNMSDGQGVNLHYGAIGGHLNFFGADTKKC